MLRSLIEYDADTGRLFNKTGRLNSGAGKELAKTITPASGYRWLRIQDRCYSAHRLAWALHYGEWPRADIDHINGVRSDNRLCNLREATRAQNNLNSKPNSRNTSGYRGVNMTPSGKWAVAIYVGRKKRHLGRYQTFEEAKAARVRAEQEIYGAFANSYSLKVA